MLSRNLTISDSTCILKFHNVDKNIFPHEYFISDTSNYILPAGATVVIGTYKIHRSPKFYNKPEVFNPDNFLPENTQNRHYYSFIPFSAGPRSCVGKFK